MRKKKQGTIPVARNRQMERIYEKSQGCSGINRYNTLTLACYKEKQRKINMCVNVITSFYIFTSYLEKKNIVYRPIAPKDCSLIDEIWIKNDLKEIERKNWEQWLSLGFLPPRPAFVKHFSFFVIADNNVKQLIPDSLTRISIPTSVKQTNSFKLCFMLEFFSLLTNVLMSDRCFSYHLSLFYYRLRRSLFFFLFL